MASVQQLRDCMLSSWYPQFQRVTFKTVILPLPQPVADWLVSDGLHLPADSQAFAKRGKIDELATEDDYREWESEDEGAASEGSSAPAQAPPPPELDELLGRMAEAIEQLGGKVVPKLSWSCPKDAVWMSPTASLACTNPDEVLLLLRSSDRVAHDICSALQQAGGGSPGDPVDGGSSADAESAQQCGAVAGAGNTAAAAAAEAAAVQHCLALRRWYDLQPGREFRCFVLGQELAGVSQRDLTQCFDFLKQERAELAAAIQAFHHKHIRGRFPHPSYTYDVYVATSGAVKLLDFNPVGGTTVPLLFSWEELLGPAGPADASKAVHGAAAGAAEELPGCCAAAAAEAAAPKSGVAGKQAASGGCCCQASNATAAAAAPEQASEESVPSSYLEQLRRVQALSLAEQHEAGQQAEQAPQDQQVQAQQVPEEAGAGAAAAAGGPVAPAAASLDFRIIEEPVAMRPHTLAYGVPFDFVDSSEGSALDRLMQQAQAAGASELWAALAQQGGGGSGAGGPGGAAS